MMEAVPSSEMSVYSNETTRLYSPEASNQQVYLLMLTKSPLVV
jgi:hypothetical protein